ncbi:hypothetical protein DPEC_G00300080 [Dallia pectoralis]|uniref:Uncharacterized protein n=1 Tax=Dallia pectoralis TaxID=75939 RepID=A0ACC2FGA7_DALPE|nr:hypothetical protein DPEC_G00300080 [Dallia pectoralis]
MITPLLMFVWLSLTCYRAPGQVIPSGEPVSIHAERFYNISHQRDACGTLGYDVTGFTCCEDVLHKGAGLSCCGRKAFNITQASCCQGQLTGHLSQLVSDCCGYKAFDPLNYLCCESRILKRNAPDSKCCGKELYDSHQLCCGRQMNVLTKTSNVSVCCGNNQFDKSRQCCCNSTLVTARRQNEKCCVSITEPVPTPFSPGRTQRCTLGEETCGTNACYDPTTEQCCNGSFKGRYPSGQKCYEEIPAKCGSEQYNPEKDMCCAGSLSNRVRGKNLCCGAKPYSVADDSLCCNHSLVHERTDKRCSQDGHVYQPSRQLVCNSYVNRPGNHCCGTTTYDPQTEICCEGHKHCWSADVACCGRVTYNRSNGQKKCCAGTLYDLHTHGRHTNESQCCGSLLMEAGSTQTCCVASGLALVYPTQPGFACCGHHYPNASLWSCCAGVLKPRTEPYAAVGTGTNPDPRLLQLEHMKCKDLCHKKVYIGTVETVSARGERMSIVMKNTVSLTLDHLVSQAVALSDPLHLKLSDYCSSPKLIPGNTYIWMETCPFMKDICFITDLRNNSSPIYSILGFFSMCRSCILSSGQNTN